LPHGCVAHSCARRWQVLALIPLQYPTEARAWWYFSLGSTCRRLIPRPYSALQRIRLIRKAWVEAVAVGPAGALGRGDGPGTWVCEQRVCESEAATNGVREIVECRGGGGGDNG
jgi:hypothetical protein